MPRRYSVAITASKGRFFAAGEDVPSDVVTPGCAEEYRIPDEQQQSDVSYDTDHQRRTSYQHEHHQSATKLLLTRKKLVSSS